MNFLNLLFFSFFLFKHANAWMNIHIFRQEPEPSTTDRVVSYLIRMWTNSIQLINGVGYSVILYTTSETIILITFIIVSYLIYKYLRKGRHDTEKTTVHVVSTMHVSNTNDNKVCSSENRTSTVVSKIIKCPDVYKKVMDGKSWMTVLESFINQTQLNWSKLNEYKQSQNQTISDYDQNIINLAKSLFPNFVDSNDSNDSIIQERFVEGLINSRLREVARTKMYKMRMIKMDRNFKIND